MLGIERVMDHVAHALGLDPLAVRQRNSYAASAGGGLAAPRAARAPEGISGQMNPQVTPYGQEVADLILHEMTERLVDTSAYCARRVAVAAWNAHNPVLKKGLALTPVKFGSSFTLSHLNQAGVLVHVYQDGSVNLNHGGTEMGQGLFQKVALMAAADFGLSLVAIKITATDTAQVPNTSAKAASSGSDLNGMAVKAACDTIRQRMAECLARHHGVPPDAVQFAGGMVQIGTQRMSFAAAAKFCYEQRISLSAAGSYKTPDLAWDRIKGEGRPFYYFAFGAAVTELVVDGLSGENRILRADILHDCGASLNPALDIGQTEGGYVQGAGWPIERLLPMRPVVIHGAGHIGRALAGILAPVPSLAIMLAESRPSLLCDLSARITPCADPFAAITIAPDDAAHVVVTHDHALDLELCHRLLLRSFGSVGLIGSASKWARFQQRLAALGHSDAQISRISCPIGDPRLGKHPQAIALGVAAALLKEPDTKAQDRRRTA